MHAGKLFTSLCGLFIEFFQNTNEVLKQFGPQQAAKLIVTQINGNVVSAKSGTDIALSLVWVQSVFKGCQQMTKDVTGKLRVNRCGVLAILYQLA